eukprot:8581317-Lingulodinium_polyedra.AAC.1
MGSDLSRGPESADRRTERARLLPPSASRSGQGRRQGEAEVQQGLCAEPAKSAHGEDPVQLEGQWAARHVQGTAGSHQVL